MTNIPTLKKKVSQLNQLLGAIKLLLKKNWGILLLLLLFYIFYWAFNQPESPKQIPAIHDSIIKDVIIDTIEEKNKR